ncbi:MAG: hypothetical protein D6675_00720 [Gemmatimonadetes bacterium]|nr:MAG: hypothetical protein D6675_00720 [Gemmatimonadota bacterium]
MKPVSLGLIFLVLWGCSPEKQDLNTVGPDPDPLFDVTFYIYDYNSRERPLENVRVSLIDYPSQEVLFSDQTGANGRTTPYPLRTSQSFRLAVEAPGFTYLNSGKIFSLTYVDSVISIPLIPQIEPLAEIPLFTDEPIYPTGVTWGNNRLWFLGGKNPHRLDIDPQTVSHNNPCDTLTYLRVWPVYVETIARKPTETTARLCLSETATTPLTWEVSLVTRDSTPTTPSWVKEIYPTHGTLRVPGNCQRINIWFDTDQPEGEYRAELKVITQTPLCQDTIYTSVTLDVYYYYLWETDTSGANPTRYDLDWFAVTPDTLRMDVLKPYALVWDLHFLDGTLWSNFGKRSTNNGDTWLYYHTAENPVCIGHRVPTTLNIFGSLRPAQDLAYQDENYLWGCTEQSVMRLPTQQYNIPIESEAVFNYTNIIQQGTIGGIAHDGTTLWMKYTESSFIYGATLDETNTPPDVPNRQYHLIANYAQYADLTTDRNGRFWLLGRHTNDTASPFKLIIFEIPQL